MNYDPKEVSRLSPGWYLITVNEENLGETKGNIYDLTMALETELNNFWRARKKENKRRKN